MREHVNHCWAVVLAAGMLLVGCHRDECDVDALVDCYRQRVGQMPRPVQPRLARPTTATTQPAATQPDYLSPRVPAEGIVHISLQDTLHRALCNSLDIKVESYSPGIAAMDIIIAEAAFDAVFFANTQYSNLEQGGNLASLPRVTRSESLTAETGVRKRLITGGEIAARYRTNRLWQDQRGLRFNPLYDSEAVLELRQPLLAGFGADVNRAEIRINTNRRDISMYEFRRRVMETLAQVEQAYWQLYFARQALAIGQELLIRGERNQALVVARAVHDVIPVQITQVQSAVAIRRANVIRLTADVRDAEDRLKNLLNDPSLPIHHDIAILPTTEPLTEQIAADPQRELWVGLEHRPELQQARLNIANANIGLDVARNLRLPRLDVIAQWGLAGMHDDFGRSNERMLHGDMQDYVIGVQFEVPIGNRGPNAQVRRSRLQVDQAITALHNAVSDVTTQIQIALRNVQTTYREIQASQQAAAAATEQLTVLVERRVGFAPDYLDLELRSQDTQADARRRLHAAIANYNIAIVQLELAKGTLLEYTNVQLVPGK